MSQYTQGRISPTRIKETLDSVEVLSIGSAESTVSDRLKIVEERPEGWEPGMPRPWTLRSPVYDKPLPMPSRTPSPMMEMSPGLSPVGRREVEPVRVLYPDSPKSSGGSVRSRASGTQVPGPEIQLDGDLRSEWDQLTNESAPSHSLKRVRSRSPTPYAVSPSQSPRPVGSAHSSQHTPSSRSEASLDHSLSPSRLLRAQSPSLSQGPSSTASGSSRSPSGSLATSSQSSPHRPGHRMDIRDMMRSATPLGFHVSEQAYSIQQMSKPHLTDPVDVEEYLEEEPSGDRSYSIIPVSPFAFLRALEGIEDSPTKSAGSKINSPIPPQRPSSSPFMSPKQYFFDYNGSPTTSSQMNLAELGESHVIDLHSEDDSDQRTLGIGNDKDWKVQSMHEPKLLASGAVPSTPKLSVAHSPALSQRLSQRSPSLHSGFSADSVVLPISKSMSRSPRLDLGAIYRNDWVVNRTNSPEHFFVASLFGSPSGSKMSARSSGVSSKAKSFAEVVFGDQKRRLHTPSDHVFEQKKMRNVSPVSHNRTRSVSPLNQHQDGQSIWDTLIEFGPEAVDKRECIEELLQGGGLPDEKRGKVWLSLLDVPMVSALSELYLELLDSPRASSDAATIEYDVCRATDDPEEQVLLQKVLKAYCTYDPVVGYAPGMLNIAITLRQELTEEQTFAGLCRVYFAWDQRRMVIPGVEGLRESLYIHDVLLRQAHPELHEHLGELGVSGELYAAAWFHALAFNELSEIVFTWFLLSGRAALVSTSVALVALNEGRLLDIEDCEEAKFLLMNNAVDSDMDSKTILSLAHQYYPVSQEQLMELQYAFSRTQADALDIMNTEDLGLIANEDRRVMSSMARLAERVSSILLDREHLEIQLQEARQELLEMHRLCYEQAYRLHLEDTRIVDDQFYAAIDYDAVSYSSVSPSVQHRQSMSEHSDGYQEEAPEQERDRIAEELVNVKMQYAEALGEIDELKNQLSANLKKGRRAQV